MRVNLYKIYRSEEVKSNSLPHGQNAVQQGQMEDESWVAISSFARVS